jgi:ribonuclease-3
MSDGLEALQQLLGHRFADPRRLQEAVTHSTRRLEAGAESVPDNERLEFLGDAVVGLVVSQFLAEQFPDWTAGRLSQARARLVNAEALSAAARRLDLGRFLLLGRGEEKTGGREKPTLLADAYEALVAALYCDAGLGPARAFIERTLLDDALRNSAELLPQPDHKSALQAWLQARGGDPAEYRVIAETGPDHSKQFAIELRIDGRPVAQGHGASKKKAEQQAAAVALERLRSGKTSE